MMKFCKNEDKQFVISSYNKYFDFDITVENGYSFLWITYIIINSIILHIGLYVTGWARYSLGDVDIIQRVEKYNETNNNI